MILLGDTVYPFDGKRGIDFSDVSPSFFKKPKIVNMEGAVRAHNLNKLTSGIPLLSSEGIFEFFEELNVRVATLANNHIFDFDLDICKLKEDLERRNIAAIGAGENITAASKPYIDDESKLVLLTFGWNVISCVYAKKGKGGVNPYEYAWVTESVTRWRKVYRDYKLVVSFHWNYEFEQYPQPADRMFAHELVELGVDLIVGHHPHIMNGYEKHKGVPIYYSLGNFFFPNGEYDNAKIAFPPESTKGLGVDALSDDDVFLIKLIDNERIVVGEPQKPELIDDLSSLSEFAGLNDSDYLHFFKVNRKKRKLLPIYVDFRQDLRNELFDLFCHFRQKQVNLMARFSRLLKKA